MRDWKWRAEAYANSESARTRPYLSCAHVNSKWIGMAWLACCICRAWLHGHRLDILRLKKNVADIDICAEWIIVLYVRWLSMSCFIELQWVVNHFIPFSLPCCANVALLRAFSILVLHHFFVRLHKCETRYLADLFNSIVRVLWFVQGANDC